MNKSAVISAKVDLALKRNAERIFKTLGMTPAQAITIFYKQVELQHGLPFSEIPNAETMQALEDAHKRQNLETFNTIDDLIKDLAE